MQALNNKSLVVLNAIIIESEKRYQEIYSDILTNSHFQVTRVSTGHRALQILENKTFDLICLAMQLPKTEGTLLCARLRALPKTMNVAILMFDPNETSACLQQALVSGATELFHTSELRGFSSYLEHLITNVKNDQFVYGRILYIEENIKVAKETCALLEEAGYNVRHCTNAKDACNDLIKSCYDLILTDLMLKGKKPDILLFVKFRNYLSGMRRYLFWLYRV